MKIVHVLVAAALASVCACQTSAPKSPSVGLTRPIDPPHPPNLGHETSRVEVHPLYGLLWTETLRRTCAGPDPFFAFDSSKPETQDQDTMQNLIVCLTVGPLQGKSIVLVGRTDPRGSEQYNDKLGLERAERVKRYLVRRGIDGARVQTRSLGKDDAELLPKDWPSDRRVDVHILSAS